MYIVCICVIYVQSIFTSATNVSSICPGKTIARLPQKKARGVKKYQHNKSVANECTNFMINLSNSFMKSINMTSILTFISIIFTCTYDSRFLIAWTIFFIKLCHSMQHIIKFTLVFWKTTQITRLRSSHHLSQMIDSKEISRISLDFSKWGYRH